MGRNSKKIRRYAEDESPNQGPHQCPRVDDTDTVNITGAFTDEPDATDTGPSPQESTMSTDPASTNHSVMPLDANAAPPPSAPTPSTAVSHTSTDHTLSQLIQMIY